MKATTIALLWLMASVMLAAQTAAPAPKPGISTKPAATQAKPAAAPAKAATAPKPVTTAKPAAKPVTPPAKSAAKKDARPAKPAAAKAPAGKAVKPAVAKSKTAEKKAARPVRAAARRDPFVSPVRTSDGPVCPTGKKCLVIDTIVLKGIAQTQQGNIALVESSSRKASYFLRENDPVFNGYVVKITGDSIVFRENVVDAVGRKNVREVVKKVVAPVV